MKLFTTIITVVSLTALHAIAMITFPAPYLITNKDESRVLVMQSELTEYNTSKHDHALRLLSGVELYPIKDFPQSGVYSLPDRKLIYSISNYIPERHLLWDEDFEHLMYKNRFGARDTWALKFYHRGQESKTYTVEDLLTAFSSERYLPFTTADYHHPWCSRMKLVVNRVVIQTSDREIAGIPIGYSEHYEFDLSTGEMRSKDVRNAGFIALVVALLGFMGILTASFVRYLRARRTPLPH